MIKKFALVLIYILSLSFVLHSQDFQNIEASKLSDAQVQQLLDEIENRGLTLDQAFTIAQSRGASPTQISELKQRIQDFQNGVTSNPANEIVAEEESLLVEETQFSLKAFFEEEPQKANVFGYHLFNNENLSFEPNINTPVPKNYVLGIGDEILINVWGASQQNYKLTIDPNGAIQIEDLGPVFINGMEFERAKKLIRNRLSSIYSGMAASEPNTFAEISVSNQRAINVNIVGEVNVPGTYSIPATSTTFNALYLSGGPNENGSFRKIQLIRNGVLEKEIDVYDFLINANPQANVTLRDQDIIFVPVYDTKVEASGAFKRNAFFELKDGEFLSDLIKYCGHFSDSAYTNLVEINRYTNREKKIINVDKSSYDSFQLKNGDIVTAGTVVDRYINRVSIEGAIYRPGFYELSEGLTLSQLIQKAEGVTEEAFMNRGLIIREDENKNTNIIHFNLKDVLNGKNDIQLKKEDIIEIKDIFSLREERIVNLIGEVQLPGEYPYHKDMTIQDLLFQAGGLTEAASESYIEISRRHDYKKAAQETPEMVSVYTMEISRDLKLNNVDEKFVLLPFDNIYIRKAPAYYEQQTVQVLGEVLYPGSYSIKSKNERISDVIKRAGGFTNFAYIEGASLERSYKIRDINLENLNQTTDTLSVDSTIREMQANLLELNLKKILENPGSSYDYKLREGDIINVPVSFSEVRVLGEVMNPIGLSYEKGRDLKYYIGKTGGFTMDAKRSKIYVLYANGTTKTTSYTLFFKNYPKIEPGCQIIVPPKPQKIREDNSGKWMAFASIISSLALAAATIFK